LNRFLPSRIVTDKSLRVKGVGDKLGVEGDIGEGVAVLDPADQVRLPLFGVLLLSRLDGDAGPARPLYSRGHSPPLSVKKVQTAVAYNSVLIMEIYA